VFHPWPASGRGSAALGVCAFAADFICIRRLFKRSIELRIIACRLSLIADETYGIASRVPNPSMSVSGGACRRHVVRAGLYAGQAFVDIGS